jgi:hypothetical protein
MIGEWKQEGTAMPLNLSPYEKPTLSKEDMNKLLGKWHGKPALPEGAMGNIVTPEHVFVFEMSDKGEFSGSVSFPDFGGPNMPINDMGMSDGEFLCTIPGFQGKFIGKIADGKIVGELKHTQGPALTLILEKGEYMPEVGSLNLPKETEDLLIGKWYGDLEDQTLEISFERTASGDLNGFIGSPNQESKGMSITEANLTDGKLTLIAKATNAEFSGQLTENEMTGEWKQMGRKMPLSLKKGVYTPKVFKLTMPEEAVGLLSGKWQGKLDSLTVIFRFEKTDQGDFVGFLDSPDQGAKDIPITEAVLKDGMLTLKVKTARAEYYGQLSGNELAGEWTQGGMSKPLSLTKE